MIATSFSHEFLTEIPPQPLQPPPPEPSPQLNKESLGPTSRNIKHTQYMYRTIGKVYPLWYSEALKEVHMQVELECGVGTALFSPTLQLWTTKSS